MAEVASNQSIAKLDCGHDQSDVFYIHKCSKTFCDECMQENRLSVLWNIELVETDYLKVIDKKRCEDTSICNREAIYRCSCGNKDFCEIHLIKYHDLVVHQKICLATMLDSDSNAEPCSKCEYFKAKFMNQTTNEFFCAPCKNDDNSSNFVEIEQDNNRDITENLKIYCVDVKKRLDLLNEKLNEYTIEIENEKAEFNKGIGHMRSKLKCYLSANTVKIDSLRAEVDKVKKFSNLLNRNDKFGIINLIKSKKLNYKLADSKLKLWVEEIAQSYVIPELTKSGVNWAKESERAFHELVPGPRNWNLNHGPFFPDNLLELTYDLIKDIDSHRNSCIDASCYCEQNSLKKKFHGLKTKGKLSQNNLDYLLDCWYIDGGYVTLLTETGKRVLNQSDFLIARVCFEEAHRISPTNWIVLDTLMGLYFVLDDYRNCLKLAIEGLTADRNYFKARVLISEILKIKPTLKPEIPVGLDYLLDCSSASVMTRKSKILYELKKTKHLCDGQKKTESQQENVRKSLQLDLNTETLSSLQSLISALIMVSSEIEKQQLNYRTVITLKITDNPLSNPLVSNGSISSKENQNHKRKSQGHDPSAKRRPVQDSQSIDLTAENMYKTIFSMFPENILAREIVQEDELEAQTQNEAQVEHLILTRYRSKQIPFDSKGKQIYRLITDLLYEIANETTAIKLPSNFMDLYRIYRKWNKLPTPLTCSIENISVNKTKLILKANEVQFNQSEAIFLTESIPYLRDLFDTNDYDNFFVRLLILRGIKESKVDYLLKANQVFEKSNLKSVQAANQTVYTSFSVRSIINKMNENNLDTLLDQHKLEETVELLASKSEFSEQEEEYLCQAIQSSKRWKRGIEMIARTEQLTDRLLKLLLSCLKNSDGTSIDRELAIKLLKLGTRNYNVMAWICILQTFIIEMRLGNTDGKKIADLINLVHDYLGNKESCCDSNGEFLSLALDYLICQYSRNKEKLILSCLGCFYKQLKCSFLSAHQGAGVSLHWKDIRTIYNHFIPKTLPTFDSETSKSISANVEELLRNLLPLVPENLNPERFSNSFKEFIDHGKSIEPPSIIPKNHVTQDLYYYLADYYLKNKEFKKAVQFYILDLILNRNRFDSWAGCALAITSQIDQYSSTNGRVFYSSTHQVLLLGKKAFRCFNEATRLKESESKVSFEYGKFAYNIASYISRVIKFGPVLENSQKEKMKEKRKRFLEKAKVCFERGTNNNLPASDEIYFTYYFLGKIAERSNILQALRYYKLSMSHPFSSEATAGIDNVNSIILIHRFGIEINYRIHACVLKHILEHENLSTQILSQILVFLTGAEESTFFGSLPESEETAEDAENVVLESEAQLLYEKIRKMCVGQMSRILRRYPNHCKSLYRIAHHFLKDPLFALEILTKSFQSTTRPESSTASGTEGNASANFSSIRDFFDPTKCDYFIFRGIQKTSNNFIDRPGSFCTHIRRLTNLLIDVIKLRDSITSGGTKQLLNIAIFLDSSVCSNKEYLPETDRENLGKKALEHCFSIYESKIVEATGNRNNLERIAAELRGICNELMKYPIYEQSTKQFLEKHRNLLNVLQFINH
ncbi:uncharacterized protein LOC128388827 [Panonychus citri]|uniref:uncharacterized protein LOC128388827 n=1 Tax=Panonychus citri TaxID=50023 RepID=UPI002306E4CB|nr:uncharacterized protein LOC128388827 [Panonychus citri]